MAKNKYIISWQNVFSGEIGFIAHLKTDHFENTYDPNEARKYPSENAAYKAIDKLELIGEGKPNNVFTVKML